MDLLFLRKNRETLLYPVQQMWMSGTKLINPQRMLVSVSQEPYFKVFKGKNLPERNDPAVFPPKTNELSGICLRLAASRMVDKARWGNNCFPP